MADDTGSKKDLTSIGSLSGSAEFELSNETPALEVAPPEKVESFEELNLNSFEGSSQPQDPQQAQAAAPAQPVPETFEFESLDALAPAPESLVPSLDLSQQPLESAPAADFEIPDHQSPPANEALPEPVDAFQITDQTPELPPEPATDPASESEPDVEAALAAISDDISDDSDVSVSRAIPTPAAPKAKAKAKQTAAAIPAGEAWVKVKEYNEQTRERKPVAAASFPFSLLISGKLSPEEREKLTDLLAREHMGISELDLEPQFASNRVLIPRISEYAGVILVQAMRAAQVRMTLGPSDQIFATEDTRSTQEELDESSDQANPASFAQVVSDTGHPAEDVIVTPDDKIVGHRDIEVIDTMTASATMKAKIVEAENSAAFQDLLENLKRELKYKAHRKGAIGVIHFSVQLLPLQMSASYRVTVMGAAVRVALNSVSALNAAPGSTDKMPLA